MQESVHQLLDNTDTDINARRLLGSTIIRTVPGGEIRGTITEVESYDQHDTASHSYGRQTPRNTIMYGAPGFAYVYLSYGIHHCMNVVSGPEGYGAGILIRSIEIIGGFDQVQALRGLAVTANQLTNGPGKVGQALMIDLSLYGHDLSQPPLRIDVSAPVSADRILATPRIGISRNQDALRRFLLMQTDDKID